MILFICLHGIQLWFFKIIMAPCVIGCIWFKETILSLDATNFIICNLYGETLFESYDFFKIAALNKDMIHWNDFGTKWYNPIVSMWFSKYHN